MVNYFINLEYFTLAGNLGYIWAPIHELGHIIAGILTMTPVYPSTWNSVQVVGGNWLVDAGGVLGQSAFLIPLLLFFLKFAPKFSFLPYMMLFIDLLELDVVMEGDFGYFSALTAFIVVVWTLAAFVTMVYFSMNHYLKKKAMKAAKAKKETRQLAYPRLVTFSKIG